MTSTHQKLSIEQEKLINENRLLEDKYKNVTNTNSSILESIKIKDENLDDLRKSCHEIKIDIHNKKLSKNKRMLKDKEPERRYNEIKSTISKRTIQEESQNNIFEDENENASASRDNCNCKCYMF